jgi:hypothetical protein
MSIYFFQLLSFEKKHVKIPGSVSSRTAVECQIEVPPCNYAASWLCGKSGSFTRPCATKEGRGFTERDQVD